MGPVMTDNPAPTHLPGTIQAKQSYFDSLFGKLSKEPKTRLTQNLKHCSKLDTLAMVEIVGD